MPLEADSSAPLDLDEADTSRARRMPQVHLQSEERGQDRPGDADPLSLFLPENPTGPTASAREHPSSNQASRRVFVLAIPAIGTVSDPEGMAVAESRLIFRENRIVIEGSNDDTQALDIDSSQLREGSSQLAEEHRRITAGCCETEERNEGAIDTIGEIEKRLGLLDVVRDVAKTIDDKLAARDELAEEARLRVDALDAQKRTIDPGLVEAIRVAELLTTLETRLTTVVRLEHRAADATADLERQVGDFESRKHVIEQALADAARVTGLLSALETRITSLTGPDRELERAEQVVARLEQRAADANDDLEQRLGDFEAQRVVIERALIEATRITDVLSGLETRIVDLTETDQLLDRAGNYVGRLERRAAAADAQLEQAAHAKSELEQEVARLQAQLESLTETARNEVRRLADHGQQTERGHSHPVLRPRVASGAVVAIKWHRAQKWLPSFPRRSALVGALGVAVLLAVIATRSPDRTGQNDGALGPTLRESRHAVSDPVSVSRSLRFPIFTVLTPPRPKAVARDARSQRDPVRLPAVVAATAVQPDSARNTTPAPKVTTRDPSREKRPAKDPVEVPQFIGVLAIESQPAGATVFVNQQPVGETPVRLGALPVGSQTVRIEREGYERWTTVVLVSADKETRVSATLHLDRAP
jgi:hypothetical protein